MSPAPRTLWIVLTVLLAIGATACGDDPPPAPEDRCEQQGLATFGGGKISLIANNSEVVEGSTQTGQGFVIGPAVYLSIPGAQTVRGKKNLILKLYTSDEPTGLIDRISRASLDAPATFEVVDASAPISGSQNISGLNNYDCKFNENKICAQLAIDNNGDGLVTDEDELVYNAKSGSVTFIEAKGLSSSFKMTWTMRLAGNILDSEDNATENRFRGCLYSSYRSAGDSRWDFY